MTSTSLTLRRQKFVSEYVETGNATQAARLAGYSPRTAYSQGSRLLTFEIASLPQLVVEKVLLTPSLTSAHDFLCLSHNFLNRQPEFFGQNNSPFS